MGGHMWFVVIVSLSVATFAYGRLKPIKSIGHTAVVYHHKGFATELFDCVSNVTRTYFDRRTVYLYFNDKNGTAEYTAVVDTMAKAVQSPKVVVPYSSYAADTQQITKDAYAFIAEDKQHVRLLNVTQQSYFVAVWTRRTTMNSIRRVFRDFWGNGKHVNVVGLMAEDDGVVNAYSYRPFTSYGCGKLGRPFLLDRWERGAFRSGVDLFSHKPKTGDMRGCPLQCVGNEHPPDTVVRHDPNDGWTTSGVGGRVLEIVARYMNFTPVITSPKGDLNETYSWYNSADVLYNITAMLYAEEADLAFGWFTHATHDNEFNTKLAKTTSIDCLGWAVPYRAGSPPRSWTNYVNEFDRLGWLFIGTMFVVVVGECYWRILASGLHESFELALLP